MHLLKPVQTKPKIFSSQSAHAKMQSVTTPQVVAYIIANLIIYELQQRKSQMNLKEFEINLK